jgi:hypothetical protein
MSPKQKRPIPHPMEVEIAFVGLCSFINPCDDNDELTEPSVILVRTPPMRDDSQYMAQSGQAMPPPPPNAQDTHIPFIAFDSTTVAVGDITDFKRIPHTPFYYLPFQGKLRGVELQIENNPPAERGEISVDESYHFIVKKSDYWPESNHNWDRKMVPKKGGKPKASKVAVFMKFGAGRIHARRRSAHKWAFRDANGCIRLFGHFYREAVYSDFRHTVNSVVFKVLSLKNGSAAHDDLEFYVKSGRKLKLWIGNLAEEKDLLFEFDGTKGEQCQVKGSTHFAYLNAVSSNGGGPIPYAVSEDGIHPPPPSLFGESGGGETGYCGPGSADH